MPFPSINNGDSGLISRNKINAALVFLGLKEADINSIPSKESTTNKDIANGYAGLDALGKINPSQLPAIAITDTFVVASQAAMLALVAQTGDVAVRNDIGQTFILQGTNPAVLADWVLLQSPSDAVSSVFGRVGVVTAQNGDYNTDQVTEATNLYFTAARVRATVLTGLSLVTAQVIAATDTVLQALGYLQAQISLNKNRAMVDFQSITAGSFALNSATFTDIPGVTLTTKTVGGESNVYEAKFNCSRSVTGSNPHNFRVVYESAPAVFTSAQIQTITIPALSVGVTDIVTIIASIPALPIGRIIKVQKAKVGMAASTDTSTNHVLTITGRNTNNIIP